MTNTVFLDTVNEVARAAMTGTALPSVSAKLLEHLKIIAKFFAGDAQIEVDADSAKCVIKAKNAPSGAPALIDITAVLSGSGTSAAYTFEWASADSVALRALLDAAADPSQPQELRCEVEYAIAAKVERIAFPIFFETAYTRPEDPAPVATTDTSWDWLKARVLAGTNITRTVDDNAKTMTLAATGSSAWADITGKPSTFPPTVPIAQSDVTNLTADLAAKATAAALTSHTGNTSNPHSVTKAQVGLGNVDNTADTAKPVSTAQQTALDAKATTAALTSHTGNTSNPHSVTKAQVGLGNVDNTADTAKPVSTAQQTALDGKATTAALTSHTGNTSNPHSVTKSQVGLSNVDNTADTAKPVSTAQQTALDGKQNTLTAASQSEMEGGTEAAIRSMSPLRIAQAITALAGSGSGGWETGDRRTGYWSAAPAGFVLANGGTIGDASSGAGRANADTEALFLLLWQMWATERNANNTPIGYHLYSSSGVPISGGDAPMSTGTAAGDYAAHYRIVLPDERLRAAIMAKPSVSFASNAEANINSAILGSHGGDENHQLTEAELPVVAGHNHTVNTIVSAASGTGEGIPGTGGFGPTADTTSAGGFGSGSVHNNVQPVICINVAIKL